MSSEPNIHDLDKGTEKISMRRFTALASETPDPTREPAEGDIYEVEDEENLPEDAKAQTIALFRNEEDDEDLPVHVWVNTSDQARHVGLSNHEKINRDEGMLFDWGEFGTHGLTMRNMSFPIDMVFLDERGYVQQIVERVQPEDPNTYTSACQYALELSSGFCEKHEIDTSWRVFNEVREFETNPQIVDVSDRHQEKFYQQFFGWDEEEIENAMSLPEPTVLELDKQDEPIHFTNVGGDPFQDYEDLKDFCAELEDAGGEVLLGDEPWEHASGHHDRPVIVYGLTMGEVEEIWSDYEDDALAIGGPTTKQEEDVDAHEEAGQIVRVDNVHQAPEDVVVHSHEDLGLFYVYEDHTVERALDDYVQKADDLEISRFVRVWVRDPDDVPAGCEALEGDGPAGNEYYYYETIGNQSDPDDRSSTEAEQTAAHESGYEYPDAGSMEAQPEVREAVQRFRQTVPEEVAEEDALLYWLLGTGTPDYKMSKEDSEYQSAPSGGEQCGNCEYLYASNESGNLICSKIRGPVEWSGWCKLHDHADPDPALEEAYADAGDVKEDWYPITVVEAMAKQMNFEVEIFRIVATEDMDMGLTSDLMAVGVNFPSHDVFVDWRTDSWPDGEELDGPHVSIYSTMNDVRDVAQGEIEMLTTVDPGEGLDKEDFLTSGTTVPDGKWDELDDILFQSYREQIWEEKFGKQQWADSDDVPEFVQRWISEVVELTDPLWAGGFNDIPRMAALTVHKEITDSLTQPQGWSVNSIVGRIVDEFEWLEADDARNIVRSEVAAVLNKAREVAYRARPDEVMVDWSGPSDSHTTVICETVKERINAEGGSVPIEELKEILRDVSSEYREKGGTPERVEEYIPHYQCRHTLVQV